MDGDLDLVTAPYLEAALDPVGADNGQATLFLDLSGVGFLDAAGWRVLESAAQTLERRGGRLIVAEVSDPVTRFMQLAADHRNLEVGWGRRIRLLSAGGQRFPLD